MISRELKLKLTKPQETKIMEWLVILTGVYNWAIRQVKLNADMAFIKSSRNKLCVSHLGLYDLFNNTSGNATRVGVNAQIFRGAISQAFNAWDRCFKKLAKEPKLKGYRNKLNYISFSQLHRKENGKRVYPIKNSNILLPGIGEVRFHKQKLPKGSIKTGVLIKKPSGWYLCLNIDIDYKTKTPVKITNSRTGIDTGFKSLITLSDGTKYENPRELRKGALRLAQAQRSGNKKLSARLHERQSNRRKDRNHKISLDIIRNHQEIYITNDNLKGQAKLFGKSISEASIGQLRRFLIYKGSSCGRVVKLVGSFRTTMTCSACGSETGPKGLSGLAVREWVCTTCGVGHDRDTNAAQVVLISGLGLSLSLWGNPEVKPKALGEPGDPEEVPFGTSSGTTA